MIHFEYTILEMFSAAVFLPMIWALHRRQTCGSLHYFNHWIMTVSPFPQSAFDTAGTGCDPTDIEISWEAETSPHCIRNTSARTLSSIQYICYSILNSNQQCLKDKFIKMVCLPIRNAIIKKLISQRIWTSSVSLSLPPLLIFGHPLKLSFLLHCLVTNPSFFVLDLSFSDSHSDFLGFLHPFHDKVHLFAQRLSKVIKLFSSLTSKIIIPFTKSKTDLKVKWRLLTCHTNIDHCHW